MKHVLVACSDNCYSTKESVFLECNDYLAISAIVHSLSETMRLVVSLIILSAVSRGGYCRIFLLKCTLLCIL